MSSIESAPATIPAISAGTFTCAFTPPLAGSVSRSATSPARPQRWANATTGASPTHDTKIRIIERCRDQLRTVRNPHPADAPSGRSNLTVTSHILSIQQGIRGLRHAKPPYRNGGSRLSPPSALGMT